MELANYILRDKMLYPNLFKKLIVIKLDKLFVPLNFLLCISCQNNQINIPATYKYIYPKYDSVNLFSTNDTLHLQLPENNYNSIKSFNIFSEEGTDYMSLFDNTSKSILIYDLNTQNLVRTYSVKKLLHDNNLYKTSVLVKNIDSIFITNKNTLFLTDTSGKKRKKIEFLEEHDYSWAVLENTNPPILKDDVLYTGVRPYVDATSLDELKRWKVVYRFNLEKGDRELYYHLPEQYTKHIFGYYLLDYSYCYNDKGHFVFSFAADTNIYETDFKTYHIAYLGKSRSQSKEITPVGDEKGLSSEARHKNYLTRDSYGAIYYDSKMKRYLRIAKLRVSEEEFTIGKLKKKQQIIILNENFQIIGESAFDDDILLNSVFIRQNGEIYARTLLRDEYTIHFVKLKYE